jgi:hypothetical protein
MPGNGNNKPPGIPSFSMEMTLIEDDNNDPNEVLTSKPVGLIKITTDDIPKDMQVKIGISGTRFGSIPNRQLERKSAIVMK